MYWEMCFKKKFGPPVGLHMYRRIPQNANVDNPKSRTDGSLFKITFQSLHAEITIHQNVFTRFRLFGLSGTHLYLPGHDTCLFESCLQLGPA